MQIASLRCRFIFFWWLGNFEKLRNQKLPFYDGDRNVCKENEPRDWVQTAVEDVRHVA